MHRTKGSRMGLRTRDQDGREEQSGQEDVNKDEMTGPVNGVERGGGKVVESGCRDEAPTNTEGEETSS